MFCHDFGHKVLQAVPFSKLQTLLSNSYVSNAQEINVRLLFEQYLLLPVKQREVYCNNDHSLCQDPFCDVVKHPE